MYNRFTKNNTKAQHLNNKRDNTLKFITGQYNNELIKYKEKIK